MCLTANATLIDAIIDERVALAGTQDIRRMFSAYDITREAKQRGATENHFQMKNSVHARYGDMQLQGYGRSILATPTGDTWVYHPSADDPQEWLNANFPNGVQTAQLPSPNTSPVTLPSPNTQATAAASLGSAPSPGGAVASMTVTSVGSVKQQQTDAEGRLPIYADQLGEISCQPGGMAVIYVYSGSKIEVANPATQGAQPFATYTVNADGRIRISGKILNAHLKSKNGVYNVTTNGDTITIEAA